MVLGEDPEGVFNRELVLLPVLLLEISPIAGLMPLEEVDGILEVPGESIEGIRGRDDPTERKQWLHLHSNRNKSE